jgi:hypothetical protein
MIAVSEAMTVLNQTNSLTFSIKTKEILKSMIKPITPTITYLIKEEFKKM